MSLTYRRRGDPLNVKSMEEYFDISSREKLVVTNGVINLKNPIGLYRSDGPSRDYVFVSFNPYNIGETVYMESQVHRDAYLESPYAHPSIVSRTSSYRTFVFDDFVKIVQAWNPKMTIHNYNSDASFRTFSFDCTYDGKSQKGISVASLASLLKPSGFQELSFQVSHKTGDLKLYVSSRVPAEPWDMNIHDGGIIHSVGYIITTRLSRAERCDPVKVSRFFTDFISYVDGEGTQGLLEGKWFEEVTEPGATSPMSWRSTAHVLEEYRKANGGKIPDNPGISQSLPKAARFGQCFIFGCLLQSFMRISGIPCRSVRTDDSAHDGMRDYVIGIYEGDRVPMWNYHVWNEAWMSRPDLADVGYAEAGWQVIDSTPQGYSKYDGKRTISCGPCPVRAVRDLRGDVKFDTKFVIGETNAVFMTVLTRDNDWQVYDCGYGRTGTKIMIEGCGKFQSQCHEYPIYDMFNGHNDYVNDEVDPRGVIIGHKTYSIEPRITHATPKDFKGRCMLSCPDPSKYVVYLICSMERNIGPMTSDEITKDNVYVKKLVAADYYKFSLGNIFSKLKNTRGHYPTVRFFVKKAKTVSYANSESSLTIFQWSERTLDAGKWKALPGL